MKLPIEYGNAITVSCAKDTKSWEDIPFDMRQAADRVITFNYEQTKTKVAKEGVLLGQMKFVEGMFVTVTNPYVWDKENEVMTDVPTPEDELKWAWMRGWHALSTNKFIETA